MTNYYEELKLDKNLSVNELRENLIRLESIWTDRASQEENVIFLLQGQ